MPDFYAALMESVLHPSSTLLSSEENYVFLQNFLRRIEQQSGRRALPHKSTSIYVAEILGFPGS